ncbi:MAG: hypothetical protein ACTSRX_10305 [Promethearchaeota archaeon]
MVLYQESGLDPLELRWLLSLPRIILGKLFQIRPKRDFPILEPFR